jgi:hypothetical protein
MFQRKFHQGKIRRIPIRWKVVIAMVLVLFLFYYLVPIAFDNPELHTFASHVRTGDVPVIFIHGLGSAPDSFFEMQERLEADRLYVNGKDQFLNPVVCDYAKTHKQPLSFSVSFYPEATGRGIDRLIGAIGATVQTASATNILSKYISTLQQQIRQVISCTGASQVDIVAYSMGGMVAKNTLPPEARHVLFLGTPQKPGLYGNKTLDVGLGVEVSLGDIQKTMDDCKRSSGRNIIYSTLLSHDLNADCQVAEYAMLLQSDKGLLTNATISTIAGNIDGRGDGLIDMAAVRIEGTNLTLVKCEHNALRSPIKCYTAYKSIKKLLAPKEEGEPSTGDKFFEDLLEWKLWVRVAVFGY